MTALPIEQGYIDLADKIIEAWARDIRIASRKKDRDKLRTLYREIEYIDTFNYTKVTTREIFIYNHERGIRHYAKEKTNPIYN